MKNLLYLLFVLTVTSKSIAQVTSIPDFRFEQALIDLGIDSDQAVNGQILTADALGITNLVITPYSIPNYPYSEDDYYEGMIHDLTGIEAFTNLDSLRINVTMVEELNLSTLVNLKYLHCIDNMLTSLDVSNNLLLEYLAITTLGDVVPMNVFNAIDLHNNPNIHTLIAVGVNQINLKNNNNNSNMHIVASSNMWAFPPDYIEGNVCIIVDDAELAQDDQLPYSAWNVIHNNMTYSYSDSITQCALNVSEFQGKSIEIYPNPINNDILNFQLDDNTIIYKIEIFDILGRMILENNNIGNNISVAQLQKGSYILKIISNKGNQTEKIIVQ